MSMFRDVLDILLYRLASFTKINKLTTPTIHIVAIAIPITKFIIVYTYLSIDVWVKVLQLRFE
jgi:hypothetical protein